MSFSMKLSDSLNVLRRTTFSPFSALGNHQLKDFSESFPLFFPSLLATAANTSTVTAVDTNDAVSAIIPTTVICSLEPEYTVTNGLTVVPVTVVYSDPEPTVTTELTVTSIVPIFSFEPEYGVANELADIITCSEPEPKAVTTELAATLPTTTTLSGPDTPIKSIEFNKDSTSRRSSLDTLVNSDKETGSHDSDFEKENESWSDTEEKLVKAAGYLARFHAWAGKFTRSPESSLSPELAAIRQLSEEYLSNRRSVSPCPIFKDMGISSIDHDDDNIAVDIAHQSTRDTVVEKKLLATSEQDQMMDEEPFAEATFTSDHEQSAIASDSDNSESSVPSLTRSSSSEDDNSDFIADPESDDDDHSNTILAEEQIRSHIPAIKMNGEASGNILADALTSDSEYFGDADDEKSACGRSTPKVKILDLHDDADDEFSVDGDLASELVKNFEVDGCEVFAEKSDNGYIYYKEIFTADRVKYEYLTPMQIDDLLDFKTNERSLLARERLDHETAHSDPFEMTEAEEEELPHPMHLDGSDLSEFDYEELRSPTKPTFVNCDKKSHQEHTEGDLLFSKNAHDEEEEGEEELLPYTQAEEEEEYDLPAYDPYNEDGRSCRVGSRCDIDKVIHLSSEADDPMSDETVQGPGNYTDSEDESSSNNDNEVTEEKMAENDDITVKSQPGQDDAEDITPDDRDKAPLTIDSLPPLPAVKEFSDGWKVIEQFNFGFGCGGPFIVAVTNTDLVYCLTPQGRFELLKGDVAKQFDDWYYSTSTEERAKLLIYHADWDASYAREIQKKHWWFEYSDIDEYGNIYVQKNIEIESGISHGRLKRVDNLSRWDDNFMWFPKKELVKPSLGPELKVTTPEGEEWWLDDLSFYPGESWADDEEDE
ncbi:hypothetical protein B0T19DRAFT_395084 [Cercophora scortea]|uniref:Uncharacterized protein n=1 Tax=Cercophora scortea TaxID=314031 RepID=A0AAE0J1H9_9PEZI|nr:hypothetical protein B0T19DRAFT_395084 [Cercophora scortea]